MYSSWAAKAGVSTALWHWTLPDAAQGTAWRSYQALCQSYGIAEPAAMQCCQVGSRLHLTVRECSLLCCCDHPRNTLPSKPVVSMVGSVGRNTCQMAAPNQHDSCTAVPQEHSQLTNLCIPGAAIWQPSWLTAASAATPRRQLVAAEHHLHTAEP